jgi:hypothetical protein
MNTWAYYIWWVERDSGGQWHGYKLLNDETLWRYEFDILRGTSDVRQLHRWRWTGSEWEYDTRSAEALYVRAGQQKLAYFP